MGKNMFKKSWLEAILKKKVVLAALAVLAILSLTAGISTYAEAAKPQGELSVAITEFGNEYYIPWNTLMGTSNIMVNIYEPLAYYDEINQKLLPGLAESWEVSPDALSVKYKLRKGVEFSDGWGEFTAEDVKFTFEKHAGAGSQGFASQARAIEKMEVPDPYTIIFHFNKPYPTFVSEFSMSRGGTNQGILSKKYVETVGEDKAGKKPIGTGPFRLVGGVMGSSAKFEARESHWRVVPEFKNVTIHFVPETTTIVAMLKSGEIDLGIIPIDQMKGLKAAGVNVEASKVGGATVMMTFGGLATSKDKRFDPNYHNKDPWVDKRVREAMSISIDREAIAKSIFSGAAVPLAVPIFSRDMLDFKYPYDPDKAKKLLADAGYKNGFNLEVMSYVQQGVPEMPRMVEAICAYWQKIGLKPKISRTDFSAYGGVRHGYKTAGQVSPWRLPPSDDPLTRCIPFLIPNGGAPIFQDEGSFAIWSEGVKKIDPDEREEWAHKLQTYYHDNFCLIPVVKTQFCYGYSNKIAPFPQSKGTCPLYLEYVRHAKPLNTFRLFTPYPGR